MIDPNLSEQYVGLKFASYQVIFFTASLQNCSFQWNPHSGMCLQHIYMCLSSKTCEWVSAESQHPDHSTRTTAQRCVVCFITLNSGLGFSLLNASHELYYKFLCLVEFYCIICMPGRHTSCTQTCNTGSREAAERQHQVLFLCTVNGLCFSLFPSLSFSAYLLKS